jgi:hypothetical protein
MFRKPIELRFYTNNRSACELFPPTKAAKARPRWLSTADSGGFGVTIQRCRGIREFFSHGVAVPLWSDLKLETTENHLRWDFSDGKSQLHVESEFGVMQRPNEALCKLIFPWAAECSEAVPFMQVQNMWDQTAAAFRSINGTLEFKYQHAVNLFLYFQADTSTIIPAGTSFFILAPLSERPIKILAEYDPEKYDALRDGSRSRPFFKNWYVKQRHIKEKNL